MVRNMEVLIEYINNIDKTFSEILTHSNFATQNILVSCENNIILLLFIAEPLHLYHPVEEKSNI